MFFIGKINYHHSYCQYSNHSYSTHILIQILSNGLFQLKWQEPPTELFSQENKYYENESFWRKPLALAQSAMIISRDFIFVLFYFFVVFWQDLTYSLWRLTVNILWMKLSQHYTVPSRLTTTYISCKLYSTVLQEPTYMLRTFWF